MGLSRRVRLAGGADVTGRVVEEALEGLLESGGRLVDEAVEEMVSKSRWNLRLVVDRAVGILKGC